MHDITISNVTASNRQTVRSNVFSSAGLIVGLAESPIRRIKHDRINVASANASGTYIRLRNIDQITCSKVLVTPLNNNLPSLGHIFDNEGGLSNLTGCDVPPPMR